MKLKIMFALTMVAGLAISAMSMATALPTPTIAVAAGNPIIPDGTIIRAVVVGRDCNCTNTPGGGGPAKGGTARFELDTRGCHVSTSNCKVRARTSYTDDKGNQFNCEGTGDISGSPPSYASKIEMTCKKL